MAVQFPEGVRLMLFPGEMVSDAIAYGGFETEVSGFLSAYLKPGMTVIDAGTNFGLYAALAARLVGPSGRVYGFEPSAREHDRALRNMELNGFDNVQIFQAALSDADGSAELHVCSNYYAAFNSIAQVLPVVANNVVRTEHVPTFTVDSFTEQQAVRHVDVMKIDVEGAESAVLRGGARVFGAADGPIILCELCDLNQDEPVGRTRTVLKLLHEYGYEVFDLRRFADDGLVEFKPPDGYIRWEEILAVKPATIADVECRRQLR